MERKDFIRFLAASAATGSLIVYLESCKKDDDEGGSPAAPNVDFTLDLSAPENAPLLTSGGFVVSNKVVVINNNGSYIGVSNICTHQSCTVGYSSSSTRFSCPCHGSVYAQNGSVINGPATSALKTFNVAQNGNSLHISG